ncbi:hypothetical protein [Aciditerrimonas ferrireducens]|jgi:hypothetical protein|uniref:hypothetical protein n=1 Tax=Aciditerrimonas ferrireducens TaxID=667306 RepID=UPI00200377B9|nr:hypothetical protein [Aciditerrimonas ferrireducens]MCK4176273.1 hypothetical protein [Aciditerrimonas ferrireducens]
MVDDDDRDDPKGSQRGPRRVGPPEPGRHRAQGLAVLPLLAGASLVGLHAGARPTTALADQQSPEPAASDGTAATVERLLAEARAMASQTVTFDGAGPQTVQLGDATLLQRALALPGLTPNERAEPESAPTAAFVSPTPPAGAGSLVPGATPEAVHASPDDAGTQNIVLNEYAGCTTPLGIVSSLDVANGYSVSGNVITNVAPPYEDPKTALGFSSISPVTDQVYGGDGQTEVESVFTWIAGIGIPPFVQSNTYRIAFLVHGDGQSSKQVQLDCNGFGS